jgi:omega-6 fatty acid desaturase (delta-12 desaturase)
MSSELALNTWLFKDERDIFNKKNNILAISYIVRVFAGYSVCLYLALADFNILLNIAASFIAGMCIGQMFIIAHDSAHDAFMETKKQNKVVSRICLFLPLHSYSLWKFFHNRNHHLQMHVKGTDIYWEPLTYAEYNALSYWKKGMYRLYRSVFGALPYYLIEMWAKSFIFPSNPLAKKEKEKHAREAWIVVSSMLIQIVAVYFIGHAVSDSKSSVEILFFGLFMPFLVWTWFVSFTFYMQHTNPKIGWHRKDEEFDFHLSSILGSNRMMLPTPVHEMYMEVNEHIAHHLAPNIPLYNLKKAQRKFESVHHDLTLVIKNGLWEYPYNTKRCKLFDFERRCWVDFKNNPTGAYIMPLKDRLAQIRNNTSQKDSVAA